MNRHEARKNAFQIIFQMDINETEPEKAIEDFMETNESDPLIQTIVKGVSINKKEIDNIISNHLENWMIDRIASVEKTILRVAVYEIKYEEDIPVNVSIDEAVELAHIFGDDHAGKFVNGVLSKINT